MREKFSSELKAAMKAGERRRVDTIRMIMAGLKDKDIEARGQGKAVSGEDILALLQKMVKSRKESLEIYEKAGRTDLATQESEEITIIQSFLPSQMSEADVAQAIAACKRRGKYIGICGQAPSDYPDFLRFLVSQNIDSVSLNPDSVVPMILEIAKEEELQKK